MKIRIFIFKSILSECQKAHLSTRGNKSEWIGKTDAKYPVIQGLIGR